MCGAKFRKKYQFFQLEIALPQARKQQENYNLPLGKDLKGALKGTVDT